MEFPCEFIAITTLPSSRNLHIIIPFCTESYFTVYLSSLKWIMSTDFAVRYPGYYPHIKHPLKWILTYSNSCKNSQDLSALGVLLNRVDPIKKMSTPITRTNFKQQLQRQQLEQQDQLFLTQKPSQPDFSQSQSIAVPRVSSPTTVPPDVPSSVLQV